MITFKLKIKTGYYPFTNIIKLCIYDTVIYSEFIIKKPNNGTIFSHLFI